MQAVRRLGHQQTALDSQQHDKKIRELSGSGTAWLPIQIGLFLSPLTREPVRLLPTSVQIPRPSFIFSFLFYWG